MYFHKYKNIIVPDGEVAMISCGDEILWQKVRYKRELLYLESTGTQWIDTGYKINNNSEIELVINLLGSNNCDVFGCRTSKSNVNLKNVSVTTGTSSLIVADFTNSNYASYRISTTLNNNCKAKIVISKNERSATNLDTGAVLASNKTVCNDVFACDTNAYLLHVSGQAYFAKATEKAKLYSLKIAEYGKLVRDFIPVLDMNDVPCMYDKVSGKLFYNQGTGEFKYAELQRLPLEYQEVEYIESTGTQWIDTGETINTATDTVELAFQNTESNMYKWFYGEHDSTARFALGSGDGANKRNVAYGASTYKVADTQQYNTKHTFVANKSGVFIDEAKIANFSSFTSTSTLYLFNLNLSSGNYVCSAKVWSYKHTRNGVLIRDFIPCYRKSDNKPGMYDLVTNTFFTNAGTGEFVYEVI